MMNRSALRRSFATAFLPLAASFAVPLAAQCAYSWPAAAFGIGCNDVVSALTVPSLGELLVGGRFTDVDGNAVNRIARWNGSTWSGLGSGMNGDVYALQTLANGEVIAAGSFTTAGGTTVNCVARWNGSTWSALGNGVDPTQPFGSSVQAVVVLANGDLVIGGSFTSVSGVPAVNIARWNGSSWSALGSGINGPVRALAVAPNGNLFAAGSFLTAGGIACNGIARWSGGAWAALGTGLGVFGADCLAALPNNDIVVGGSFLTAGGSSAVRIARWNSVAWSALGTGLNAPPSALLALPSGDLIAGGVFTTAGGAPANSIARWNGSAWSALAGGTNGVVLELAQRPSGDLVVGGTFTSANGGAAGRLALLASSCAPTTADLGAGCSGAGGPNVLTTTHLPLLGASFRARGTGMPPIGFVLTVTGFTSTSLPLSFVLPQALPGCTLFANADFIDVAIPAAGVATSALAFPVAPSLVGGAFFHQYVPLELDLALNITGVTATNALALTIGTF